MAVPFFVKCLWIKQALNEVGIFRREGYESIERNLHAGWITRCVVICPCEGRIIRMSVARGDLSCYLHVPCFRVVAMFEMVDGEDGRSEQFPRHETFARSVPAASSGEVPLLLMTCTHAPGRWGMGRCE